MARSSLEEARLSIRTLSDAWLGVNLAACLQGMAERYRSMSTKTRVDVSVQGTAFHIDSAIEENLCHIAQQATDNALQHARASSVRIELAFREKQVQLKITDDGQGFEINKADCGFGLTSMRERAKEIGGEFNLKSQPGKGTRLEVHVPLRPAARGAAS